MSDPYYALHQPPATYYHAQDSYHTPSPNPNHIAGPSHVPHPLGAPIPPHRHSPHPSLDGMSQNGIYGMPQLRSDGNEYHGGYIAAGPSVPPQHQYQYHQPYQSYPQPVAPPLVHAPPPQMTPPTIDPLPPPTPKVAYDAPVFQTFQQKKRAKELAMMAQVGAASTPPRSNSYDLNSFTPPSRALPTPTPSTLAMMGQGNMAGPPAPPPRSPSLPPASSFNPQSPNKPNPPSRSPSIPSVQPHSSRPLPQPVAMSTRPSVPYSSPSPSQITRSPSPIQATLERSDTLSSVKSLDRMGFGSSGRPLPKPPVGVNSSKSLDRGIIPSSEPLKRGINRKQPSTVSEEDSDDGLSNGMASMSVTPSPLPRPPSIKIDSEDPKTPAKFVVPTFSFPNDGSGSSAQDTDDEDTEITPRGKARNIDITPVRAPSPGIVITGLPTIAVSSSDSPELPEISFSVPTFSFDSDPEPAPAPLRAPPQPVAPSPIKLVQPNGAIICAGCQQAIIGRIVSAMKERWHPGCFSCAECGELLEHVSSYEWEGKAYCHLDYHDKFAHRCHHCKTPIVDSRFVTLEDPHLGQRYYHELHFFCSECGDPFLDPSKSSAPGTEKSRANALNGKNEEEEDIETNDFVIHKGHPYCERCHLRLHKPKCKACSKPIPDVAVNAMGAKWHRECFNCSNCGNEFANNLFFPKEGKALCTTCYEESVSKS